MTAAVLLFRGQPQTKKDLIEATDKFRNIFNEEIICDEAKNSSQISNLWNMREHRIIFLDQLISTEEFNMFEPLYNALAKKPLIVTTDENMEILKTKIAKNLLHSFPSDEMSKTVMFDYMRSAIVNKNRTIDPRIVGSILKSVVDVIQKNTTLPLKPQPVKSIKSNAETTDVTAMCSFHGDGLQGTIIITTETKLVTVMVEKMLGLSPENVDTEMINDLMLELLNQVMGVVRLELRDFSYELNPSAFFVVHGDNHSYMQRALGKTFLLPFIYEDSEFKVRFCYDTYSDLNKFNDTYATLEKSTNILNVELVNAAVSAISEALAAYMQEKPDHVGDEYYRQTILTSSVTNYAHGVSSLGDYNFLLKFDEASARALGHKMLFMPAEEIPMDLLLDSCGELLNQISANFRTITERLGYKFRHVFHGDFGTSGELSNSIRTNSKFLELNFKTADFPITVYFGSYWKSRYNILDLHSTLENLNKKSSA